MDQVSRSSGPLATALAARALQALFVALIVGVISFVLMQALPGDAAYRIAAARYGYDMMDAASADLVRAELALDQPWTYQLWDWLARMLQFDLGQSVVTGTRVVDEIAHQLGNSLHLALGALMVSVVIAIPVGVIAGVKPGGIVDRVSLSLSILLRSVPAFALGVLLIMGLAVQARLLPVAGYRGFEHLILPSLTLGLGLAAVSNRVVRDAVADALSADWYQFARMKGLSDWVALRRHVVRNVSVPVIAYVGVQLAYLIEGVVIVETVFAWPGIGHALVHAIFHRDIGMVQGTALTLGLLYVTINMLIDLVCRWVDPRVRASQ